MSIAQDDSLVQAARATYEAERDEPMGDETLLRPPRPVHRRLDKHRSTQTETIGSSDASTNSSSTCDTTKKPPRHHSRINLLTPPSPSAVPPILCLHSSNDSCMRSWLGLIEPLYRDGFTVLLYDRPATDPLGGGADLPAHRAVSELCAYLYGARLEGPFVVLAHGYGACIARLLVQRKPHLVAGMVLIEAGQETALAAEVEAAQYRRPILGDAPLAVVRGNLMRSKQDEWAMEAASVQTEEQRARLEAQRLMLQSWDAEDERLKKKQLGLSRNSRYRQVEGCGHHPILERPDEVLKEVRWVMGQLSATGAAAGAGRSAEHNTASGLRNTITRAGGSLRRKFSVSSGHSARRGLP